MDGAIRAARIEIIDPSSGFPRIHTQTDATGRFAFTGLGTEPVRLDVRASGLQPVSLEAVSTVDPQPITLTLPKS